LVGIGQSGREEDILKGGREGRREGVWMRRHVFLWMHVCHAGSCSSLPPSLPPSLPSLPYLLVKLRVRRVTHPLLVVKGGGKIRRTERGTGLSVGAATRDVVWLVRRAAREGRREGGREGGGGYEG